jgi:hypothetical protein
VLASPERNKDQPSAFRFARLNLSASNSPAPNPIAPRVTAMIAISGTVKVLTFDFDIFTCHLLGFALCLELLSCVLFYLQEHFPPGKNTSTVPFSFSVTARWLWHYRGLIGALCIDWFRCLLRFQTGIWPALTLWE